MKKILSLLLILCLLTISFASCEKNSKEDQQLAEACATQAASKYYNSNFKGNTIYDIEYSDCKLSIENSDFKNGTYIITVDIFANVSYEGYHLPQHLMYIEYSITVKNGNATIINTEYITE